MQCWSCRDEVEDAKPFCANCGVSLAARCSSCSAELTTGKSFCANCGTPVSSSKTTPSPQRTSVNDEIAPTAERRLCSVLFVDLVGFTPLAEKRDPEHVRELLTLYFDRAQRIIENYGGTVEKFIGDAVMAVWGAPTANEDDAERAVRAALDVVASVTALGAEAGLSELRARGGVVTGEVAITIGKVSEGMVLGDTVNTASRVQSAALPGSVLVDESTWRATSGAIAFESFGALELKGKSDTINAWRATRVVAQRKGLGRSQRLEPPFVGRDEELRLIKDLLHATARDERIRLVSVTGVAGIGKSRLTWEFLKYVDGLADDVYWHQGRSRTYGEGIIFGALGEMVRMRAGILETEDATSSMAKLRATLEEFVRDPEERRWVEPSLAHLLGFADAPSNDREELFSMWRLFFERVAAAGTTVLVFEDLQWADSGLIDFVESMLEWSRNLPLLIITLSRPELMERRPQWGAGQRNFISQHLDPLAASSMRELLAGFVHGLPDDVVEQVLNRAEGVPLYAVETIRMLVDRGVLVEEAEGYRVDGVIELTEIPETLQALVASRLDALPTHQRVILQDAGVVGSTFSLESLAVVNGGEHDELEAELRELIRKEFLAAENDPRSPERGQYTFVQGVIREVAVGMLARRDRSAKHLAIARYVEALGDDELAGVVAAHYLEAHRATPEESSTLAASALEWLERAGDRAQSLGSSEQALSNYESAIELAADERTLASLHVKAGEAASFSLADELGLTHGECAVDLYESLGEVDQWALATAKVVVYLSAGGHVTEAVERARSAFERLGPDGDALARARLAVRVAMLLGIGTDVQSSLPWSEIALILAEELDDSDVLVTALDAKSCALFNLGRHREAVILARGMVSIADESGVAILQDRSRSNLSIYLTPDDPRSMVTTAQEALTYSRKGGRRGSEILNLLNVAEASIYLGLWTETRSAIADLRQRKIGEVHLRALNGIEGLLAALTGDVEVSRRLLSEQIRLDHELVAMRTTAFVFNSLAALAAGELGAALRDSSEAVTLDPSGINVTQALSVQAHAAIWLGDLDAARQSLASITRIRGRAAGALRRSIEAGVAALEGRIEDAVVAYRDATDRWRNLENVFELALCELDLVTVLGPEIPEVAMAKEARDIFTQLGATPFLERLNQVCGDLDD